MSELSLSERLLSLDAHPSAIADLCSAVYDALEANAADPTALRVAAGLSSESTRLVLSWMGHGNTSHLEGLTETLQAVLAEKGETAPLDSIPPAKRLASRFHELARIAVTYQRTNNTARHVGALAGRRRETWREIAKWAYKRGEPFSVAELREAGFYSRRRESAYEALEQLVGYGLLAKDDVQEPAVFSLTWEGRSACRSLWSPEEIGRDGEEAPQSEDTDRRLQKALRAHWRAKKENAYLRSQLAAAASELQSLRDERAALAVNGSLGQHRRTTGNAIIGVSYAENTSYDDAGVLGAFDAVEEAVVEKTYRSASRLHKRTVTRGGTNEDD